MSLLVTAISSGPIWAGVGIWVKALELHFRWSRTKLTGAFALAQLEGSIIGPMVGFLVDRLGARRMVLIGLLTTGVGFIVFSLTKNLPIFYLSYAIIMLGSSMGTWLPTMASVNKWFIRRRATAMAIANEGYFVGGVTLAPVLAWAVAEDHAGWRATAFWIGIVFLVVAWPISRCIRNRPQDYGQLPDGNPPPDPSARLAAASQTGEATVGDDGRPEFTARQALRTRVFWQITLAHALNAITMATLTVHLVPMLTDQDLSLQMSSYVWSVLLAAGAVSVLAGGYIGDRVPKTLAIFVFSTIQSATFVMFALVRNAPMAFLVAAVFGIGHGGRSPLTMAIKGDYFGTRAFATITGISIAPVYIFMLIAPLFAAAMFDIRGSYVLPFFVLGFLGLFSGVLFLTAKKPVSPATVQERYEGSRRV